MPRQRADAARDADSALLVRRLRWLGLGRAQSVCVHENRTVLVSVGKGWILRVHRGYAYAPDRVLRAILEFVHPCSTTAARGRAELVIATFPVERYVPLPPRRSRSERERPGDDRLLTELERQHRRLNGLHFGDRLGPTQFRLSGRMETRLGELEINPLDRRHTHITISRRHIVRDGWGEVELTLLHEMVHQWQAETGRDLDHGDSFRRKARAVGIAPRARRDVLPAQRAAHHHRDRRT